MAKGRDIHVVPQGKKWAVEPEGGKPTSTHRTQDAAIDQGRAAAKRNESELNIHGRDGQGLGHRQSGGWVFDLNAGLGRDIAEPATALVMVEAWE